MHFGKHLVMIYRILHLIYANKCCHKNWYISLFKEILLLSMLPVAYIEDMHFSKPQSQKYES